MAIKRRFETVDTDSWSYLWREQYDGATAKDRVAARQRVDRERNRLMEHDKKHGTKLCLAWTIAHHYDPIAHLRSAKAPDPTPLQPTAKKVLKRSTVDVKPRLVLRRPSA